jgi:hypothetical protein
MNIHTFSLLTAGSCALFACVSAATFPMIAANQATSALSGAECSFGATQRNTNANRSESVAQNSEGLRAHPVMLCKGERVAGQAIFWSGTNAEGNRLVTKPTDLSGREYHIVGGGWDQSTGTNTVEFEVPSTGGALICTITKPKGGISPYKVARCADPAADTITTATFASKTVVYDNNGTRQTWNADGTSLYGSQKVQWDIKNGQYCSKSDGRADLCWDIRIINGGTQVVFEPNAADPVRYVGTFVN